MYQARTKLMKMSKVLITGAAGFIGSHVAEEFIRNNYEVVGVDNLSTGSKKNIPDGVRLIQVDLNNKKYVKELLLRERPKIISHHASNLVGIPQSIADPQKALQDIAMSVNLFEFSESVSVEKIIFSSSANVYSPRARPPINENSAIFPSSPYGVTKLAIEAYCGFMQRAGRLESVILRYFNVYGPRQKFRRKAGIIPLLINNGLQNQPINIYGNGKQTRDFTYVADVARANFWAAEKDVKGIFNVGSGKAVSINKLIDLIEKILEKRLAIRYRKSRNEINKSEADVNKIKIKINWQVQTSLENGLTKTVDYYRE